MLELWAVEAVGEDPENDGEPCQLGVYLAACEMGAVHTALSNVSFDRGGSWNIVAYPVSPHQHMVESWPLLN